MCVQQHTVYIKRFESAHGWVVQHACLMPMAYGRMTKLPATAEKFYASAQCGVCVCV